MTKRMLIDAFHPEETRVVIVDGTKVEELDFESAAKRQLRGNLYLARVTRVEPSLQAAFVEYGGNRHGFLAFSEIHPDYYQIPYEDRMALLEAQEAETLEEAAEEDKDAEAEASDKGEKKGKKGKKSNKDEAEETNEDGAEDNGEDADEDSGDDEADEGSDDAESEVAAEQEKTAQKRRKRSFRNRYKIQEVIKRGQILLIQVVKEERGNKGAAMTTYLSLAGRYCVLMPNTPKGGGISRKIANGSDRKRLKSVVSEFKVPQGMGVIVRTAGAKRTKAEIKRDYDYLCRLWETIRSTTLKSIAPSLIHEEGNLVKRSIRDLYNKDISEVLVQGDDAYKTAKNFIKMLMPSHAKNVKAYKDPIPLFLRYQVESQIEDSLESVVQLKSGGYLVIHPTEALVSVDVNSGRSTKERNVEKTALKTNLEAADEVARQMRLRDLAGLVVIDFIDMDEYRNNRSVEKRMRDALSRDRARVQASRISQFGLMEISRQRRRRSLLEGSTVSCPHCEGVGRMRTTESAALKALRALEERAARGQTEKVSVAVSPDVATFMLNHKRAELNAIQTEFGMYAVVMSDPSLISPNFEIKVTKKKSGKNPDPLADIEKEIKKAREAERRKPKKSDKKSDKKSEDSEETEEEDRDEEKKEGRKRRRRGRRGGRKRRSDKSENGSESAENDNKTEDGLEVITPQADEKPADKEEKPKRSRRRRSSKKSKDEETKEDSKVEAKSEEDAKKEEKPKRTRQRAPSKTKKDEPVKEDTKSESAPKPEEKTEDKPKRKSTTRRKAPARKAKSEDTETETEKPKAKKAAPKKAAKPKAKPAKKPAKEASDDDAPKKRGWWQRKSKKD